MDFLEFWTSVEDVFSKDESKAYTDTAKARMFCPHLPTAIPLSMWMKEHHADSTPDNVQWGHILVIPSDHMVLEVDRRSMAALASFWRIPVAAARHLLADEGFGCYEKTADELVHRWYGIPVSLGRERIGSIRLVNCTGKLCGKDILNTVIFCPKGLTSELEELISNYKDRFNFNLSATPESLRFLTLLVGLALDSWKGHLSGMAAVGELYMREMVLTEHEALAAEELLKWDQNMMIIKTSPRYLHMIQRVLKCLDQTISSYLGMHGGPNGPVTNILQASQSLYQVCISIQDKYEFMTETLDFKRNTHLMSIQVNNTQYMRTNTIELRKIGEFNQKASERTEMAAEASRRDTYDMKRVAYLTMIYLPATFVATFFSMPFMAMSDDFTFRAWRKLWIYFVVSGIVTLTTFAVSTSWDSVLRVLRGKGLNKLEANERASEGAGKKHNRYFDHPVAVNLEIEDLAQQIRRRWAASPSESENSLNNDSNEGIEMEGEPRRRWTMGSATGGTSLLSGEDHELP
ncbi:hypothetical protein K469DRAFT_755017 [Zopfia rhizophila CBS 207.26]|uniref:Cora-domain-containing protein n=1 Tax=Zopfia rhizophila CBS 207.26 TaxID=1314779 RepID=A0A6A6DE75_9PEZI|nr:hypothetical protein K469DRAFT_755017 [Zopfia rhizophila CBS 207.26]